MKFKKIVLSLVTAGLLTMPSVVSAEDEDDEDAFSWLDRETWALETSGELIGKLGGYIGDGIPTNPKVDANGKPQAADLYRAEATAKLFLNQEIGEETSWHAGLQYNFDDSQIDGYRGPRQDSQFDWLRELYLDTASGDMSWRLGKQQVVWGKADGVKFLDIINPTDYRHWGQDSMEDSRIPLWMINGEYAINDNSSLQVVYVLQTDVTNQIPGLYNVDTGDQGQPFVPLGMDTMLGQYNGFKNIGPDLGNVAGGFVGLDNTGNIIGGFNSLMKIDTGAAIGQPLTGTFQNLGANGLQYFSGMTVKSFVDQSAAAGTVNNLVGGMVANSGGAFQQTAYDANGNPFPAGTPGTSLPPQANITGDQMLAGTVTATGGTTNLFGGTLNRDNPTTMFDYMADTTFSTFDAFVGMKTKYVRAHEDINAIGGNLGIKYAGTNDDIGLNYTFNYYYHYDNNPVIDVSWEGSNGAALVANRVVGSYDGTGKPVGSPGAGAEAYKTSTMNLLKADGSAYNYSVDGPATMVFTEKQNRINTFGLSFDYAIDTPFAPIILRSEMVYDKDTLVPVVDLGKLAYGDLEGAFQNERADFFNYVIGLDVTVMTNLFVSFQFMDKWNLDYVDESNQYAGNSKAYSRHTANAATMSMANGFKKAEEHQIMYTFFLSKPFLESDALRVNNIFLLENDGYGYWDRFDFEYSYSDNVILSAAVNLYGGDKYGVFGQFENVSNAELGFKYLF